MLKVKFLENSGAIYFKTLKVYTLIIVIYLMFFSHFRHSFFEILPQH